jgi:hypothetical protein
VQDHRRFSPVAFVIIVVAGLNPPLFPRAEIIGFLLVGVVFDGTAFPVGIVTLVERFVVVRGLSSCKIPQLIAARPQQFTIGGH